MNDTLRALDDGNISVLTLLDLSAAFRTIDHKIILAKLENFYGICSTALSWFESYWKDTDGDHRQQQLKTIHSLSRRAAGLCPQSCLIHFVHKTTFKLDRT